MPFYNMKELQTLQFLIQNFLLKIMQYPSSQLPYQCIVTFNYVNQESINNLQQQEILQSQLKKILTQKYKDDEKNLEYLQNAAGQGSPKGSLTAQKSQIIEEQHNYRQIAINRYKAKKRNHMHQVIYNCRKEVADKRLRIKGRFISKNNQMDLEHLIKMKNNNHQIIEIFNDKNNLDLQKLESKFKLFTNKKLSQERMSKNDILETISKKFKEKELITKRISKKQQVFQIMKFL